MPELHRANREGLALALIAALLIPLCPCPAAAQKGDRPMDKQGKPDVSIPIPPERAAEVKARQGEMNRATLPLKERLHERTEALEQLYRSYRLDESQARRLQQEIRDTQDQLMDQHHRFQVELRRLLTQTEFEMLQQRFRQARERKLKSARWSPPELKLNSLKRVDKTEKAQQRKKQPEEALPWQKRKGLKENPKSQKQKATDPAKKEF